MSWSPDMFIGELRPWPDTVHVVRGKTEEGRRYVPERTCTVASYEYDELLETPDTGLSCGHHAYEFADSVRWCPKCGARVVTS